MGNKILFLFVMLSTVIFAESDDHGLFLLKEGNKRFVEGRPINLKQAYLSRSKWTTKQFPFCAILACSDSRVAPEIIFDQGIGDLFVVRLAGNVASKAAKESLDFAASVLKVPLIVVMGHQNCGAVLATLEHSADQELGEIATLIAPVTQKGMSLEDAIMANIARQVELLKEDPILKHRIQADNLKIVPAYYHFETGIVDFLETKAGSRPPESQASAPNLAPLNPSAS